MSLSYSEILKGDSPDHRRHEGDVDWLGIALLTAGVGSLQYVLEQGNSKDWFSNVWIVRLSILSGVSLISLTLVSATARTGALCAAPATPGQANIASALSKSSRKRLSGAVLINPIPGMNLILNGDCR